MNLSAQRALVSLAFGACVGLSTWHEWYGNYVGAAVALGLWLYYGDLRERWGKGER